MLRAVNAVQSETGGIADHWRRRADRERSDVLSGTWSYVAILAWAVFLGATVRVPAVLYSGFPLNDGGMFMQAIVELKNAHFVLPEYLHYNGLQLPYSYPPLGFYVAGIISSLTHQSILTMLRFIPLAFSIATIVAFIFLAQSFVRDRAVVVAATIAFALVPRSHNWEIMGGGLTRSIGFFFAVLAIWQVYLLFTERSRAHLTWAIVLAAATCVSHLEMALFVAVSSAVMLLFYARTRQGVRDALLVAAGVLVVTSPWWAVVLERHGIAPFISASDTSGRSVASLISLLVMFNWGDERSFPIFGAFAALAIILSLARRQYFLPLWIGIDLVVDPRKFQTEAMVPLSIMIGICVVEFLIPVATRQIELRSSSDADPAVDRRRAALQPLKWLAPAIIGIIVFYGWFGSLAATASEDVGLSASERQAMAWVQATTNPGSRFAVISGDEWARDRSSEWFPVLAARSSVATVQGYEWLPDHAFAKQSDSYKALQKCATDAPSCIDEWSSRYHVHYDYLYIAHREQVDGLVVSHSQCCSALVAALERDHSYSLVYQNTDATIFRVQASGSN